MGEEQKLDSWKEISAHLGRDERTVQRWAKERGLPVHRVPGGKRGGVFAYAHELDAWLNGLSPAGPENAELSDPVPLPAAVSPADPPLPTQLNSAFAAGLRPAGQAPRQSSSPRFALSLVAVATLALAASAYFILAAPPGQPVPVRVAYGGSNLVAYDKSGQPLWSYNLPGTFMSLDPNMPAENQQTRIYDFDGDGEVEVFSAASWLSPGGPHSYLDSALFRFSASGELLQRFAPTDVLSYAGRTFSPPWTIRAVLFEQDPNKEPSTWLAFSHHTWWPAFLVRLDARGRPTTHFTHAGWIQTLALLPAPGGRFILAGGINNQAGRAMLAVLPENGAASSGPPDANVRYLCDHCPEQAPFRYYLFPRSEIARAARLPYNQIVRIAATESGFHVYTEETPERHNLIYEFTADFQFVGVSPSDYYTAAHDGFFKEGKLDHPAAECPESRYPPLPLEWRDGAWRQLKPASR